MKIWLEFPSEDDEKQLTGKQQKAFQFAGKWSKFGLSFLILAWYAVYLHERSRSKLPEKIAAVVSTSSFDSFVVKPLLIVGACVWLVIHLTVIVNSLINRLPLALISRSIKVPSLLKLFIPAVILIALCEFVILVFRLLG